MGMTKTRYTGVYYRETQDKEKVYYITYKIPGSERKLKWEKVGTKGEGISPIFCKKLRDQKIVKIRLGEMAPDRTRELTLKEVSDEYFEQLEAKSKKNLGSVYDTHLNHMGNMLVCNIDEDAIEKLRRSKLKEVSKKTKRTLSPKTVNNILALLSSIMHYAKKRKYIKAVPHIKKNSVDNTRSRFLSTEEIEMLYRTIDASTLRTKERIKIFVMLSLSTGGRLNSILGIQGKHIDRTNRNVTLHNYKTESTYTAYIPQHIMDKIPHLKPQEYLIPVADEKQIQRPLQGIMDRLFNEGLDPEDRKSRVVIHTLRHTFASHLAINGTPIQTIMKLMDHSDIKMTLRYAKLMPDQGREAVEALYG